LYTGPDVGADRVAARMDAGASARNYDRRWWGSLLMQRAMSLLWLLAAQLQQQQKARPVADCYLFWLVARFCRDKRWLVRSADEG
jgi:hypothetical protein